MPSRSKRSTRRSPRCAEAQTHEWLAPAAGLSGGQLHARRAQNRLITRVWHDPAIVLGRRPFVLVVLTRGLENPKASTALIAEITRQLYRARQ